MDEETKDDEETSEPVAPATEETAEAGEGEAMI